MRPLMAAIAASDDRRNTTAEISARGSIWTHHVELVVVVLLVDVLVRLPESDEIRNNDAISGGYEPRNHLPVQERPKMILN